ncbi:hypothetical protein V5799_008958 [Amblyomma americanum]|uniref:Uncharacterized protein n=1 Tax=Amblyomma americanum TaxID=6943 RepID=A0AAQ4FBR6_AMBAM
MSRLTLTSVTRTRRGGPGALTPGCSSHGRGTTTGNKGGKGMKSNWISRISHPRFEIMGCTFDITMM